LWLFFHACKLNSKAHRRRETRPASLIAREVVMAGFRRFAALLSACLVFGVAIPAGAADYPTRPIRWLVPYPAGGTTDILSRIMADFLAQRLGQPVIIENKPGAANNIATQAAISSPPDGHTILLTATTNAINATFYEKLPFNFLRDIAPVGGFVTLPFVLIASPAFPAKTVPELITYAKANPGKVNMGSFGTGTISHLAIELLKLSAGINVTHVPYRSGVPMVTDMFAGRVETGIDAMPNSLQHIQRGALQALAVTNSKRSLTLPDVPTIGESVPGFAVDGWIGIGVPSGTPPEVIAILNREINAGLADPAVKKRLADLGAAPFPFAPAEFGAYVAAETEKWGKVVRSAGVKAE
jgi:tripartite-type tricarboxylate transporter receptor subunit TctC